MTNLGSEVIDCSKQALVLLPPSLPCQQGGDTLLSCRHASSCRWLSAHLSLTLTPPHLTHIPPCPPDDADLVELKQELQAAGDIRHRSPSRSLSVPNRPRPPHPPQRPPPPSKTLLLWACWGQWHISCYCTSDSESPAT